MQPRGAAFSLVHAARDHTVLHSFPTRRSSDLHRRRAGERHDVAGRRERVGGNEHLVRSEGTRLNSSHLGISYAVFCVKKNNRPTSPVGTKGEGPTALRSPTKYNGACRAYADAA